MRWRPRERKLKAGEALFRLGDKSTGLYEVVAGRVRLTRVDRDGREIVLFVAAPGDTIAEASLFSPTLSLRRGRLDRRHRARLSEGGACLPLRRGPEGGARLSPPRWRAR